MPLGPGRAWTFVDESEGRLTIRVESATEVGDESCWRVTWNDDLLGEGYQGEIWCPREEGLALVGKEVGGRLIELEGEAWLLKTPIRPGASWSSEVSASGISHEVEGTVVGMETVDTPAGRFEAVNVRMKQSGSHIDRWFVRGIGLVQEETVLLTNSLGVKRLAELPGDAPPSKVASDVPKSPSATERPSPPAAGLPTSPKSADDVVDVLARLGVDRELLEEIKGDDVAFRKLAMTMLLMSMQMSQRSKELNEKYDLSTAEGVSAAAPELGELAATVRELTDAQEDERIRKVLDQIAVRYEKLSSLAREDPERAAEEYSKKASEYQ